MATIGDFQNIEIKIGTIRTAEYIEGADKLLKLMVDFGTITATDDAGIVTEKEDVRQILSGIRAYYEPEQLIGKQCPFVTNLEPRTLRGLVSHGMILAVGIDGDGIALLHPDKPVPPGSLLR